MEELLAQELRQLGASSIEIGTRNVSFEGDTGFMYKANLCCRTAIKILKPITAFNIFTEEDLYKKIYEMPWENYMDVKGTLAVNATVFSDVFTHSQYISLKTKDAIVDRFRDREGVRPDVDLDHPTLRINVHIDRNICTVSLDSSGESLHKRGYKVESTLAPINEVLAAGIIMLSGWSGQCNFLDPMCGGGTILTEAAMIACNIPPNLNRDEFGFETWPDFDVDLYEKIEEAALKKVRDFPHKIYGFDTDAIALKKAKENIKSANLQDFIEVKQQDFFESEKESDKPLYIVFNPPYDERISLNDVESFYSSIGNTLKRGYPGTQAWMITSNMEALKFVGLRPSKKIKLFNGKLEAKLVRYEMYEGSRKASKQ
jgi:putative N6-adenine-specific DNA methylase